MVWEDGCRERVHIGSDVNIKKHLVHDFVCRGLMVILVSYPYRAVTEHAGFSPGMIKRNAP